MLELGYVRFISGTHKGKIARYVGIDEKQKAMITFSYDQDFLSWPVYSSVPIKSLSNDINLIDIIDRYYNVVSDLNKISLKGHPKIKKYSAKHSELICESHLLRYLLKEYTSISQLQFKNKETNICMMSSFQDLLWSNDLIAELTMNKWHVAHFDHEITQLNYIENAINMCSNFIFILSSSYTQRQVMKEYNYILSHKTDFQRITIVCIDPTLKLDFKEDIIYIDKQCDSDTLRRMVIDLEKKLINHDSH